MSKTAGEIITDDFFSEGVKHFEAGRYIVAMEYFQAAIEAHPDRENAYLKLADTYMALDKTKDALSTLHKLLTLDPYNEKAQDRISKCQLSVSKETILNGSKTELSNIVVAPSSPKTDPGVQRSPRNSDVVIFTIGRVRFKMVRVMGGTFMMGATKEQNKDCWEDEEPEHMVTLDNYYIAETLITQALWEEIMKSNPSNWKGDNLPVERVSFVDVQEFVGKINRLTSEHFRLPTEAEWEYAARGGNRSCGYMYSGSNSIDDVAWYWKNSGDNYLEGTDNDREVKNAGSFFSRLLSRKDTVGNIVELINNNNCRTHPVKEKKPNELGVFDMSGNVWEWCSDRYGKYQSLPQINPRGPKQGSYRVCRGGGWFSNINRCRVSDRLRRSPKFRGDYIGFRLAMV